ncbi:MAG: hypothetical protein H7X89_16345 [Rhizobiales bacterium]|nr:hypothetical protein [Hyphomicrobiales bacterium]
MNKLSISIAALALLSTASFAEQGNHGGSDGYGTDAGDMTVNESRTQAVYTDEETSTEGLTSSQRSEPSQSNDRRAGHGGDGARR